MERELRFTYDKRGWSVILPEYIAVGGTLQELLMVFGADSWLEFICEYTYEDVWITISDERVLPNKLEFIIKDKSGGGAQYVGSEVRGHVCNQTLFLSNFILFLFDKYPDIIYYNIK